MGDTGTFGGATATDEATEIRQLIDESTSIATSSEYEVEGKLRRAVALARQCGRSALQAEAQDLLCRVVQNSRGHDLQLIAAELGNLLILHRQLRDEVGQVQTLTALGGIANNTADYVAALDYLHDAEEISDRLGNARLRRGVYNKLTALHMSLGNVEAAMTYATRALDLLAGVDDPAPWAYTNSLIGHVFNLMGKHEEGVASLNRALGYVEKINDQSVRAHFYAHAMADLSQIFLDWDKPREALSCAERGASAATDIGNQALQELNWRRAGRGALALGNPGFAKEKLEAALKVARHMGAKSEESVALFDLSSALARLGLHKEALDAYRTAHQIEIGFRRDETARRVEFRRVKQDIDDARREMETADRILFTVLPEAIAKRIKGGESHIADEMPDISVLFADLVGFTVMSTKVAPRALLERLETIFDEFDRLTASLHLEKIKTIGDAYMVVGGALQPAPDHLERSANLAIKMIQAVNQMREDAGVELAIRIGLHAGPAIAGVIGTSRLSYDLWGETINFASRLEASGLSGRIHVSDHVAKRLGKTHRLESRGMLDLKGLGTVPTYFLN